MLDFLQKGLYTLIIDPRVMKLGVDSFIYFFLSNLYSQCGARPHDPDEIKSRMLFPLASQASLGTFFLMILLFLGEHSLEVWLGTLSAGPTTGFYLPQMEGHSISTWASWGWQILCGSIALSTPLDWDRKDSALYQMAGVLCLDPHTHSWARPLLLPHSVLNEVNHPLCWNQILTWCHLQRLTY